MTYRELYRSGLELLRKHGVDDPETDAKALVLFSCRISAARYLAELETEVPEREARLCRELFARRAAREPLQYITGNAPFFGHSFLVRPGVLIPRFDTERAVEEVLRRLPEGGSVLELGAGSGCILLSVLLERPDANGLGVDLSEDALACAEENRSRLGVGRAAFQKSDLYETVTGKYDIIVSNPPYIPSGVIGSLSPEVRNFEPRLALDGGADGLEVYRRIAAGVPRHLKNGGSLIAEIGFDQAESVAEIFRESGLSKIERKTDYGGNDRVLIGEYHV